MDKLSRINPPHASWQFLFDADGIKAVEGGFGLLHPQAYYTLNEIPK
jgi:hypothetical protein